MSLFQLITQHAAEAANAGDWNAVAAILNAPTVIIRNEKSWTMADLIGLVGSQAAAFIGGTIKAAGASNPIFDGAWIALNVTGLQLHTDERQSMIDGLASAGNWSPELTAAVKAAGVTYASLAGDPVTPEQCQQAWQAADADTVWSTALNEFLHPAISQANRTRASVVAAMRAAADAVESV